MFSPKNKQTNTKTPVWKVALATVPGFPSLNGVPPHPVLKEVDVS